MIPAAQIRDPDVAGMAQDAISFLTSQPWCTGVSKLELGWATAGVLGVFQATIDPARPEVDSILWVVVGDLPSAYVVLDEAPTWRDALERYVEEMSRWVVAVRAGEPLDEVIPVAASPTPAHAEMLASRLAFIRERILGVPPESLDCDV
jgi:hypothetical protein